MLEERFSILEKQLFDKEGKRAKQLQDELEKKLEKAVDVLMELKWHSWWDELKALEGKVAGLADMAGRTDKSTKTMEDKLGGGVAKFTAIEEKFVRLERDSANMAKTLKHLEREMDEVYTKVME